MSKSIFEVLRENNEIPVSESSKPIKSIKDYGEYFSNSIRAITDRLNKNMGDIDVCEQDVVALEKVGNNILRLAGKVREKCTEISNWKNKQGE
jgi:hypothetical protein